jgi:hypothetical protein
LFDPGTGRQAVVWMRYDADGRITGSERSDASADIARARRARDLAVAHAVPLDQSATAAEAGRATHSGSCRRSAGAWALRYVGCACPPGFSGEQIAQRARIYQSRVSRIELSQQPVAVAVAWARALTTPVDVTDPADIEAYLEAFRRLQAAAVAEDNTRQLITEASPTLLARYIARRNEPDPLV